MAELRITLHTAVGQQGWTLDVDRRTVLFSRDKVERLFGGPEYNRDVEGRSTIQRMLREGWIEGTTPDTTDQVVAWWLIWINGDAEIQAAAGVTDMLFEVAVGSPLNPVVTVTIAGRLPRTLPSRPVDGDLSETPRYSNARQAEPPPDTPADLRTATALRRLCEQLLSNNPLTTVAADSLDKTVGRGNWRFDPKQQVWILRSFIDGKVNFAACRRVDKTHDSPIVDLPQDQLASWWQRLAAGGGSQTQLPLFAKTLKWLSDDKAMLQEALEQLGEQVRRQFQREWSAGKNPILANARLLARRLHSAHKFRWDDTFSKMARDTAESRPQTLLHDMLVTARLPYETGDVWFEWMRDFNGLLLRSDGGIDSGVGVEGEQSGVWGALIMPSDNGSFRALVATPDGGISPGSLMFDFRNPVDYAATGYAMVWPESKNWGVLGREYVDRWRTSHAILEQLAGHAAIDISGPLYGQISAARWTRMFERDGELSEHYRKIALTVGGIFRELLSGWALAVTHIDDEPLVTTTTIRTPPFYSGKGKFRPSYAYTNVVWRRPQELPKLLRKIRRIVRTEGMRQTEVSGHWAHRRAPNKDCAVHPRACGRQRQWRSTKRPEGLWGHDDRPLCENDYQKCIYCDHVRWWVRDHPRGDPKYGIVEKSYTITASTGRRRPPPVSVDPPPEPGPQLTEMADTDE